ncbi:hypothetical protein ACKAV7_014075 [Fusarium commune]
MWNSNDTRPRVMTYVRRDPRLLADQIWPFQTRDILWLTINDLTIVNFYRQNDERDALDTLFQWSVPERCLVAGDFNARHRSWQTGQTTNRGQEITGWVSENDLSLLNTLDIPTNPYGNTIHLAFTNLPLAEAIVEDHLATSSDHFTLSLTFPDVRSTPVQPGKIRVTTEDELKRFVEIVELGATGIPLTDSTPEELDELASSLVGLLTSAAKASGRPARKGGRPAPWWTEECADAAAAFRAIRRSYLLGFNQDVQIAKRGFHRVEAEVVMIAKPGRRDLTKPRAWRPISLLSCLGKGLERLIARRLAWAAVHYSVLHPQQAGALPKRSATDLVTALVHDIEEAFACKRVATLVTMDIQGAFNTVMCNRLVLRLRKQGWPNHLAYWAGSFMGGRSARVRYQDTVTPSSPLQCGLPQGSPVSPILFLLYTEPIYRLGNPQGRFGYADDTAILSIGDTVDETSAMASSSIAEMVR